MTVDKQFVFIIGSPRSGTTWLQLMIGAHPRVCTTVELTLYSAYTAPWIKAWKSEAANIEQGRWHQGLPFLWTEDEFYAFLREFLGRVYERVAATNPQATHVLDKHPGYSMCVADINKLLPQARFIHPIRDGRDVAVSMVAARRQMGFGTGTVADSAAAWQRHVRAAQDASQYRDRYLEVRYEDLSATGVDTLKCVLDFCGLPASMQDVTAIVKAHQFKKMKASKTTPARGVKAPDGAYRKGEVGTWQEDLRPLQRYLFDRIAGDLLCELGYAEEGWWAESKRQEVILCTLNRTSLALNRMAHAAAIVAGPALTGAIKESRMCRLVCGWVQQ